ncbi:MAG: Cys-tRNA(Pro) deacylase [Pleomorphochaeta sp.]
MSDIKKTNAMRILEKNNIEYELFLYEVDENNLDAIHVAQSANLDIDLVYKTIVFVNENKENFVFCLPAEFNVSLKKAKAITHSKSLELIKVNELKKTTGYIRGGCSPIGMIKSYETFISDFALMEDQIYISGGRRGLQIKINPTKLARCIDASFEEFI